MPSETDDQRGKREHQRVLFDGVVERYDASRQGYPIDIVDAIVTTAEIGPGASVLELGCGTGQLTRQLAGRRFDLTGPGPFDLIVSATAFHWVDPEVGLAKAARLLGPGAWLALLSTGERYPEPLRTALRELWVRYNRSVEWTTGPSWVADLRDAPLFGEVTETTHQRGLRLPAEAVVGVECTRATFLSYSETDQAGFAADLRRLLEPSPYVELVQETLLGMAQLRS